MMYKKLCALCTLLLLLAGFSAQAQQNSELPLRSDNLEVLSHVPLGAPLSVTDIVIEQEMERPYAYVGRMQAEKGFDIIDLSNPERAEVIYRWRMPNEELHVGLGGMDPKYFKHKGRYYVVQSLQFFQGGPNTDAGAVVVDVTGLPDTRKVETVGYVRNPDNPGGFHNIFMYKHSDGRPLLFATTSGDSAFVYDLGAFVEGKEDIVAGTIPNPETPGRLAGASLGYHDFYVGYHPDTQQDRFYGGGAGGYFVFDVTRTDSVNLLATVSGVSGVVWGHTVTPSPDGRYIVGETEYMHAPLRIFDLKPALDGDAQVIRQPISSWNFDYENLVHNHEVRWPYLFVSGYEDGLLVVDLYDPAEPKTVAYYDTFLGSHRSGMCGDQTCNGAFGVDVRNEDGLIVVSDMGTGFWAFRLEDFQGWNGRGWGMPNISSAQNWDDGPAEN